MDPLSPQTVTDELRSATVPRGTGPRTLAPSIKKTKPKHVVLGQTLMATNGGIREVLREMRRYSGVGDYLLGKRLGIKRESVRQYFNGKRPSLGGVDTTVGFLVRFAEACGCRVIVRFPDREER